MERLPTTPRWYVITGATQGLGRLLTLSLAQQGHHLVAIGRQLTTLNRLGETCQQLGYAEPYLCPLDLSTCTEEQIHQQITALSHLTDRIDGLIHCAGNPMSLTPLSYYPASQWQAVLHMHLTAPFLLTKAYLPFLKQARQSKVLFIQQAQIQQEPAHWGAYGVAQAGLEQLVATWQSESAYADVRFELLRLPPFQSAVRRRLYPGLPDQHWQTVESVLPSMLQALFPQNI